MDQDDASSVLTFLFTVLHSDGNVLVFFLLFDSLAINYFQREKNVKLKELFFLF